LITTNVQNIVALVQRSVGLKLTIIDCHEDCPCRRSLLLKKRRLLSVCFVLVLFGDLESFK